MLPRPDSLAEVARRAIDSRAFEFELADFLHEFALRGGETMLVETPSNPSKSGRDERGS